MLKKSILLICGFAFLAILLAYSVQAGGAGCYSIGDQLTCYFEFGEDFFCTYETAPAYCPGGWIDEGRSSLGNCSFTTLQCRNPSTGDMLIIGQYCHCVTL